jgi:hypothetical protein
MSDFSSRLLPDQRTALAPDRSDARVLLGLSGGGMAHFQLAAGQVSAAVVHPAWHTRQNRRPTPFNVESLRYPVTVFDYHSVREPSACGSVNEPF